MNIIAQLNTYIAKIRHVIERVRESEYNHSALIERLENTLIQHEALLYSIQ